MLQQDVAAETKLRMALAIPKIAWQQAFALPTTYQCFLREQHLWEREQQQQHYHLPPAHPLNLLAQQLQRPSRAHWLPVIAAARAAAAIATAILLANAGGE